MEECCRNDQATAEQQVIDAMAVTIILAANYKTANVYPLSGSHAAREWPRV
jgi:hypothetical protein